MLPSHPLNKNCIHLGFFFKNAHGWHFKVKHILGGAIGLLLLTAINISF